MNVFVFRLRRHWRKFLSWWRTNPSLTRFLPRWANKRLQKLGERRRSAKAALEPETNLPFPYNDATYLQAYCLNRQFAEPDFEAYWTEQQRRIDEAVMYRKLPLLKGYTPVISLIEEPQ